MKSEAYQAGWQAFRDGAAQQENPYEPHEPDWYQWDYGWRDAAYSGQANADDADQSG